MLARVRSAAVLGIDAYPVDIEIDLANGLPSFSTVGLPHGAIKEGRERVSAAIVNSGFEFPLKRITVNLAPADVPKAGSAFDLPIAIGILAASGQIAVPDLDGGLLFGELGLEGALRPIRGALSLASCARAVGAGWVVLPTDNAAEGAWVDGIGVFAADRLRQVVDHLSGRMPLARSLGATRPSTEGPLGPDFSEVRGQRLAKRALEVATAGGHNVLLVGPPGAGKTMLVRRLPGILPPLTPDEALEVAKIQSVAGLKALGGGLPERRPFRAPHHTISDAGLSGGGPLARPGEVSLAHHGVLFLDELPEFRRNVLEVLRQPLEDGVVTLARAAVSVSYPARFTLAAAMNPCPCGHFDDPNQPCSCAAERIERYRSRISGPLYDRIDLHLPVPAVPWQDLVAEPAGEASAAIRERVMAARARQQARLEGSRTPGRGLNADLTSAEVDRWCAPDGEGRRLLGLAMAKLGLSARAYTRVLKVARTIADLEGSERVRSPHVAEAVQYRGLDRRRPS